MKTKTTSSHVSGKILLPVLIVLCCLVVFLLTLFLFKKPATPEFEFTNGWRYHPNSDITVRALNSSAKKAKPILVEINGIIYGDKVKVIQKNDDFFWNFKLPIATAEKILTEAECTVRLGFSPGDLSRVYVITVDQNIPLYTVPQAETASEKESSIDYQITEKEKTASEQGESNTSASHPPNSYSDDIDATMTEQIDEQEEFARSNSNISARQRDNQVANLQVSGKEQTAIKTPQAMDKISASAVQGKKTTITGKQKKVNDDKSILQDDEYAQRNFSNDDQLQVNQDSVSSPEDMGALLQDNKSNERYLPTRSTSTPQMARGQQPPSASYLSIKDMKDMIKANNFFDMDRNNTGTGVQNQFIVQTQRGASIIIDRATGLTWQQAGSATDVNYDQAEKWIRELNRKTHAGYKNWRLPTLKETMTLMETKMNDFGLNIDAVFDRQQHIIWTSSLQSANAAWVVNFDLASCYYQILTKTGYVRAVR